MSDPNRDPDYRDRSSHHSNDRPPHDPDRPPGGGPSEPLPERPRNVFGFFVVVALVVGLVLMLGRETWSGSMKKLTPRQFLDKVENGLVKKATLHNNRVQGELAQGGEAKRFYCVLPPGLLTQGPRKFKEKDGSFSEEMTLFERLSQKIPEFKFTPANTFFYAFLLQLAPWFLIFAFAYFFIIRRMNTGGSGGGVLSFGRSRARLINEDKVRVKFEDVAGIEEAKAEVEEIVQFLKNPQKFQRIGARIPRGVMLVGPPGTGKTLLAKAIAGEAGVPFFSISGSDFVEMFVGVGASRVRDLFRQAKERSPSIIYLDEIDAVGRRRGAGLGGGHDEREQTLNAILVEMDGFHTDQGVIVLASTNRPDVLDPALSRPGRFDREITIDLADVRGREEILKVHARRVVMDKDVDLKTIARTTPGYSGADLEAVINEAALSAVVHGRDKVSQADLDEAREKVRWGREKRSMVLTEEDKWTTAVHEAGHALLAHLLPNADKPHKVSIIPRGRALGVTMSLPERDRYNMPRKRLLDMIKMLYGGRLAEQLLCDDIDGGAQNDIERATKLARAMVCRWGMSDALGPINYSASNEDTVFLGREVTRTQNMSEQTAQKVDEEIARIISACYEEARALLEEHRVALQAVSLALMRHEVLSGDEVAALIGGQAVDELRPEPAPEPEPRPVVESTPEGDEALQGGPTDADLETEGGLAF